MISKMLCYVPRRRMTMAQALQDPFFHDIRSGSAAMPNGNALPAFLSKFSSDGLLNCFFIHSRYLCSDLTLWTLFCMSHCLILSSINRAVCCWACGEAEFQQASLSCLRGEGRGCLLPVLCVFQSFLVFKGVASWCLVMYYNNLFCCFEVEFQRMKINQDVA